MNALTDNGFLPGEHFKKKSNSTEDANFSKTTTEDLIRQARHPIVAVSVDAAQCYDRVNHVIKALLWSALIEKLCPITVFFSPACKL